MKKTKNNLDERQEQKLLHIESVGCWFAFWSLLISLFIQQAMYGFNEIKVIAGEWIIFMCLSIYISYACIKNGIWDRHLKANSKTNFLCSIVASITFSGIIAAINYINYKAIEAAVATFVIMAVLTFVLCFAALSICTAMYKKHSKDLENSYEDDI